DLFFLRARGSECGSHHRAVALAEIVRATSDRGGVARSQHVKLWLLHRVRRRQDPPPRISQRTRAAHKIARGARALTRVKRSSGSALFVLILCVLAVFATN